jgi:hypothetical protein
MTRRRIVPLDLKQLLDDDVITETTYDWLKPLFEKELNDIKEIQEAAFLRKIDPFFTNDNDDDDDSDDSDDGLSTMTKTTIDNIEGTEGDIQFLTDTNSSGHGNKVWHASIATCRYLKELIYMLEMDTTTIARKIHHNDTTTKQPFHCLELGAGTALPSLFLPHLLTSVNIKRFIIHITDAKEYRNIKQILMSVELFKVNDKMPELCPAAIALHKLIGMEETFPRCIYRVSPHNWGEKFLNLNMNKNKNTEDESSLLMSSSSNIYDLVIISDCIYNPQYHDVLLDSLVSTLKFPSETIRDSYGIISCDGSSGRAVISFSLHGNVDDTNIWDFIKIKIPSRTTKTKHNHHPTRSDDDDDDDDDDTVSYKLHARCVSTSTPSRNDNDDEGWYMKETMTKLGLESDGIEEKRWYAYVYEITWVVNVNVDVDVSIST